MEEYLVFKIEDQAYCVSLLEVDCVLRSVFITHIPDSPPSILGVVDVRGEQTLIVDVRHSLGLDSREIQLSDQLILFFIEGKRRGISVDQVLNVVAIPSRDWTPPNDIHQDFPRIISGVANWQGENLLRLDHKYIFSSGFMFPESYGVPLDISQENSHEDLIP